MQLSRGPIKGHFCLSSDYTRVAQNLSPSLGFHIHAAEGGEGGEGGGAAPLLPVTAYLSVCKTELMMPLTDWPVEGCVTASSGPASKGCGGAPLNAGIAVFAPPGSEVQRMGIAD